MMKTKIHECLIQNWLGEHFFLFCAFSSTFPSSVAAVFGSSAAGELAALLPKTHAHARRVQELFA